MAVNTKAIQSVVQTRMTRRKQRIGQVVYALLAMSVLIGLLMLIALLIDVATEGIPWLRGELFTEYHSRHPEEAGMRSAIVGSVIIMTLTALFSFPLGVGAAVYLEEYAPRNRLTQFIQINISNLAGVPSIIYGMLGLALFSRFFGLLEADGFLTQFLSGKTFYVFGSPFHLPFSIADALGWEPGLRHGFEFYVLGLKVILPFEKSLMAGALTMTLLILPVVIIASREAIRAVPPSLREAAFGLGATRWQVVSRQVLPAAMPGIMTGMILALSRAIGEAAPLIILGAFTYVPFLPESVWDIFTVMPIQIYNWISLPQHEYRFGLAGAGILVMLAVLLTMNTIAVIVRNRFEKKW